MLQHAADDENGRKRAPRRAPFNKSSIMAPPDETLFDHSSSTSYLLLFRRRETKHPIAVDALRRKNSRCIVLHPPPQNNWMSQRMQRIEHSVPRQNLTNDLYPATRLPSLVKRSITPKTTRRTAKTSSILISNKRISNCIIRYSSFFGIFEPRI